MTTKCVVVAVLAALLVSLPGSAQTASDLLQKGIHAQEATGDLDVAIAIFRQVVNSSPANKALAAQAQYQLVLCMLQKGDRETASKELAALERNFGDMPELVAKARKLIPGTSALLPAPWGDSECAQLNIKRDGVETGEYLYYSADAFLNASRGFVPNASAPGHRATDFRWELKTKNSTRSIRLTANSDTMRPVPKEDSFPYDNPRFNSDDDLGDPLAVPFAGPATDAEESVFLMRRLPLAVGYKTTLPVTSNQYAPHPMELIVTGIESVQTTAGKFNCYKVSFAAIGQTLWIGVEGARPLVKFRSGNVEAELVKVWGSEDLLASLAALAKEAGGELENANVEPGGIVRTTLRLASDLSLFVTIRKIHTSPAEIAQALQHTLRENTKDYAVHPGSLQTRSIGGQQAISCVLEPKDRDGLEYEVWIRTENLSVELFRSTNRQNIGVLRWRFDPIIDAIRIP
jgi:hypothetical protein